MKQDSTTEVRACDCKHAFQDERYGKGQRLHNRAPAVSSGGKNAVVYRCTVCTKEKAR